LLIGFASALFFKFVRFREDHAVELITLTIMAFFSYLFAELLGLSGIVSLFTCAIVMGRFTWNNLSEYSKISTPHSFKSLALFSEHYVFLFLGLSIFSMRSTSWNLSMIMFTVVLCIVGRFLHVFPLSILANCWRKKKLHWKEMVILWTAGLRGAIAFVLALHCLDADTPHAQQIVTSVLALVMITVWLGGGSTSLVLKLLKFDQHIADEKKKESERALAVTSIADSIINSQDDDMSLKDAAAADDNDQAPKVNNEIAAAANDDEEMAILLVHHKKKQKRSESSMSQAELRVRRVYEWLKKILLRDPHQGHVREFLLSSTIPHEMKLAQVDMNLPQYEPVLQLVKGSSQSNSTSASHSEEQAAPVVDQ